MGPSEEIQTEDADCVERRFSGYAAVVEEASKGEMEMNKLEAKEAKRICALMTWCVYKSMKRLNVNKSELARRMFVSRQRITQILDGRSVTLKTLARIGAALKSRWNFELQGIQL